MEAVVTNGLTKYYGKSRGIVDLSLTVQEGDFFGFIGPNGAGKSTFIRTLLGLISPSGGSAQIFGMDITKDHKQILGDIGYLPSEAILYSGMRVADILKLSAKLRKTDCSAEAAKLCERFELDTGRKIDELSYGTRKKVAIVCALQHNPRLLILDEPTGGLDPLMQREFFKILREKNECGTTVFISSHILSEIQKNCRRAAIIRDGKIIACGSVEELSRTNAKRVTVQGSFSPERLSGVKDIKYSDIGVSFLYSGSINVLMKELSLCDISDLTVAEPDLEEIFMHYYSEGGDTDDDYKA